MNVLGFVSFYSTKVNGWLAGLFMLAVLLVTAIPAQALYVKIDRGGKIHLTSDKIEGAVWVLPGEEPAGVKGASGAIDQQLSELAGERNDDLVLFLAAVRKSLSEIEGAQMLLPPHRVDNVSDSVAQNPKLNFQHARSVLEDLILEYERNLTVILGVYYLGQEQFEDIGGVPAGHQANAFVERTIDELDNLRQGQPVMYVFRDDKGVKNIISIRSSQDKSGDKPDE